MAIVKVKLMTQYQKKDGTHAVVIYINEKRPQYVYTDYSVLPDQFVDGQNRWIRKHPDATIMNARLEDLRREVQDAVVPGIGYIKGHSTASDAFNFCDYLRSRALQYGARQQEDMRLKCNRMAFELSQVRGRDIYCQELNTDFIREFQIWCEKNGNTNNTVMRKIKNIRYLYGNAITDGKAPAPNPITNFKLKFNKVKVSKLTADQIKALEQLKLPEGDQIDHARNAFLFSYYAHGMRFESVCTLKWSDFDNANFYYENIKGSANRQVRITPQLRLILDKYKDNTPYVFPFLKRQVKLNPDGSMNKSDLRVLKSAANVLVNKYLKVVGSLAGIREPLHFHKARHSFSFAAKKKLISVNIISDALGHSDTKITQAYLDRLDDDTINDAIGTIWD